MQKLKLVIIAVMFSQLLFAANSFAQIVLFNDNFNQTPVNPIVTSGQPAVNYFIWTTVTPASTEGGTTLIEDYTTRDGLLKLLARNCPPTQTGDRIEVSAPLSAYNTAFKTTLNSNTKDLEWIFTLRQNRSSSCGSGCWIKVYSNSTVNWTWNTSTSDNDPHPIYATFNNPGTYTVEISMRSDYQFINRFIMFNETVYTLAQSRFLTLSDNPLDSLSDIQEISDPQYLIKPDQSKNNLISTI